MHFIKTPNEKKLTGQQRKAALSKMLKENYPRAFTLVLALIKIGLICVIVAMQGLQYLYRTKFYYIFSGFWLAPILFFLEALNLVLLKVRVNILLQVRNVMGIVANVVGVVVIVLNLIATRLTCSDCPEAVHSWINYTTIGSILVIQILSLLFDLVLRMNMNKVFKEAVKNLDEENDKDLVDDD